MSNEATWLNVNTYWSAYGSMRCARAFRVMFGMFMFEITAIVCWLLTTARSSSMNAIALISVSTVSTGISVLKSAAYR